MMSGRRPRKPDGEEIDRVPVSGPTAAIAQAAGATVVMVSRSERLLEAVQKDLDTLSRVSPAALSVAHSWGIDPKRNQVVLTVTAGRADNVRPLVTKYGQAVSIEESANRPQPANYPWLDGGIPYINSTAGTSCSTGFNMRNTTTGAEYVLTAGHCGDVGDVVTGSAAVGGGGVNIGSFVSSWFPTWDDALVQVTNAAWLQGPWVWVYPGFLTISGYTDAGVGTVVCQTGQTTNLTCAPSPRRTSP